MYSTINEQQAAPSNYATVDAVAERLKQSIARRERELTGDVDPTIGGLYELMGLGLARNERDAEGWTVWYLCPTQEPEEKLLRARI